jgi:hypothetical protein
MYRNGLTAICARVASKSYDCISLEFLLVDICRLFVFIYVLINNSF